MKKMSLFEPIKIGGMEVKNKISMAPMGAFGLVDNEGCYNQRAVDYYVERAKGGAGLIITSITKVENELDKVIPGIIPIVSINPGRFLMTSAEMTERVHAYGSKIFLQVLEEAVHQERFWQLSLFRHLTYQTIGILKSHAEL